MYSKDFVNQAITGILHSTPETFLKTVITVLVKPNVKISQSKAHQVHICFNIEPLNFTAWCHDEFYKLF